MTDAEKEALAKQDQVIVNCFHRVFKSDDGKQIIDFFTEFFSLENPAFIAKRDRPFDPLEAAYRDGQRSIILQVYRMLNRPCIGDANVQPKTKVIRE